MRALRHLLLIAAVAAIAWGGLLHAEEKEVFEPGTGKYVLVLRDPNTDTPDPKTKKKAPEPDLAKHGGKLLFKDKTSRIIKLPTAAAKALRKEENVAYLQRVWLGESLDGWEQTEGANMDATLKTPVESDAVNLTWTTGTFSYDSSGNIKAIGANTYAYDKASRLSQASINGVSETYKYDSFGNLTERATAGQPHVIRVESSSNRLTGESYDAAGNVTTRNLKPAYSYDSLNQMDQIVTPLNSERRMIYGPDEERIGVIIDPALSRWKIRDFDGRVLREFEDTLPDVWQWREDHVYEEGRVIGAERLPYYGGKRHFHTDHLGSVRMITNDQHMRIGMHNYYPFGLEQTSVIQSYVPNTPFWEESTKFTGHERDYNGYGNWDNTDYLDYMHARYYDPGVGRFLSVDPARSRAALFPQSWNRYMYALNNPIKFVDPDGRDVVVGPAMQASVDYGLKGSVEFAAMYERLDSDHRVRWIIEPAMTAKLGSRADSTQSLTRDAHGRILRTSEYSHIPLRNALAARTKLIAHEGSHIIEILQTGKTLKERYVGGERGTVYPNAAAGPNAYESTNALQFEKQVGTELGSGVQVIPQTRSLIDLLGSAPGVQR